LDTAGLPIRSLHREDDPDPKDDDDQVGQCGDDDLHPRIETVAERSAKDRETPVRTLLIRTAGRRTRSRERRPGAR